MNARVTAQAPSLDSCVKPLAPQIRNKQKGKAGEQAIHKWSKPGAAQSIYTKENISEAKDL